MKLGTRLLIFSSIFLVLLPWFGYHFIEKIEQSLLQGQEEAQSMVASAIATVLTGYTGLFDVDESALYVYPAENDIVIDGYDEDWGKLEDQFSFYADASFSLLLVANDQYLYAYLKVKDNKIIYRNPRYVSLDSSDHIRLEYIDENNNHRRLVLLTEGQGSTSVYEVNNNWQAWKNGAHINTVYGNWRETKSGYDVEFRLPKKWLEPNRRLSISIVNVFGENERNPDTIVATRALNPDQGQAGLLNPLLFQSQEISSVIKNLGKSESRICVIDKYRRVRAVTGGLHIQTSLCQASDKVSETLVDKVLLGRKQVTRYEEPGETLIVAAFPVYDGEEIIGAVLVSKNSRQILSSQRDTLKDIVLVTLGLFALVFISLLIFSSWLAFRINRLKNQTLSVIDDSGRFVKHISLSDTNHRDEIGELSRGFSSLLDKLNRYTGFLETVPRMLRHEILNPVNTISLSLQSLQQSLSQTKGDSANVLQNVDLANNAVLQLQLIVSSLTEAASIDEALTQDELEAFDIAALLSEYVKNSQLKHAKAKLRYQGVENGIFVLGNDLRIVQLLDKLKDNALDFALDDTEILFQLDENERDEVIVRVKNEGKAIPQQRLDCLFQGMMTHRPAARPGKENTPHLGIGLYVSYQIARYHQGRLQIVNWGTGSGANQGYKQGVEVVLILPTIKK
jgi:signal transduction histidine kinase